MRTNKKKYLSQLAVAELHQRYMRRVEQRLRDHATPSQIRRQWTRRQKQAQSEGEKADMVDSPNTTPRYVIADTTREKENVLDWVTTNRADVATKVWEV